VTFGLSDNHVGRGQRGGIKYIGEWSRGVAAYSYNLPGVITCNHSPAVTSALSVRYAFTISDTKSAQSMDSRRQPVISYSILVPEMF
jgi:hypothetical protein